MSNKSDIIAKIRALLAKTSEAGATEHEAIAAAERARLLMDKYQVEEGDLKIIDEGMASACVQCTALEGRFVLRIMNSVDLFCDVYSIRHRVKGSTQVEYEFMGLRSDADMAGWLTASLAAYAVRGAAEYAAPLLRIASEIERKRLSWQHRVAFVEGCGIRISQRLRELAAQRYREAEAGTRALVPINKREKVEAAAAAAYPDLKNTRTPSLLQRHKESIWAGARHGERAELSKPLGAEEARKLLEELRSGD